MSKKYRIIRREDGFYYVEKYKTAIFGLIGGWECIDLFFAPGDAEKCFNRLVSDHYPKVIREVEVDG